MGHVFLPNHTRLQSYHPGRVAPHENTVGRSDRKKDKKGKYSRFEKTSSIALQERGEILCISGNGMQPHSSPC